MTFRLPFLAALLALSATVHAAGPRVTKTIDRDWTFQYFPQPTPDGQPAQPAFDDSKWQAVAVPHTWSTYETTGDLHPFIRSASERDDRRKGRVAADLLDPGQGKP